MYKIYFRFSLDPAGRPDGGPGFVRAAGGAAGFGLAGVNARRANGFVAENGVNGLPPRNPGNPNGEAPGALKPNWPGIGLNGAVGFPGLKRFG